MATTVFPPRTGSTAARPTAKPASLASHPAIRFWKTPKGTLLVGLGLLTTVALLGVGFSAGVPIVGVAMLSAALTDLALMTVVRRKPSFPSGALLTGLIVALVLSPSVGFAVAGLTATIAVVSKYVVRTRWSNVFNPAALGLVVAYFVVGAEQSWWGALPTLPVGAALLVLGVGGFIADRVNKMPLVLTYLGAFFGLFTLATLLGSSAAVAEVFRSPDANAALFLALFMLDDPPTSPARYRDQIVFALIAATTSFLVYLTIGAVYYLPIGILVANAWESWRRVVAASAKTATASRSG